MKRFVNFIKEARIHQILFYIFLFFLPWQTRILFNPETAYVSWYFNYHLAFFFYLTDILLIICFTTWFIFEKPFKRSTPIFWLILALILLIFTTLFHVKHENLGLYQALKWVELLLLIVYVSSEFKREIQFRITAIILFIAGIIQSLIGLAQFHMQHGVGLIDYIAPLGTPGLATIVTSAGKVIRAYGTMPHPNILGAFLILSLICGLYLVPQTKKIKKILILLGLSAILLGLFVTFSRLAWVGALLAIVSFAIYWAKQKDWATISSLAIAGLLAIGLILGVAHETLQARVADNNPTSLRDRSYFNRQGIKALKSNPLIGVGVGNYVPWMTENFQLEPWQYQPPHNIFIFTAAELGILGLGLFIALIWKIFWYLKKIPMEPLPFALIAAGIIFLVMSQFDHYFVTIQQGRLMFFTVLGLLAALPNLYAQKSD